MNVHFSALYGVVESTAGRAGDRIRRHLFSLARSRRDNFTCLVSNFTEETILGNQSSGQDDCEEALTPGLRKRGIRLLLASTPSPCGSSPEDAKTFERVSPLLTS